MPIYSPQLLSIHLLTPPPQTQSKMLSYKSATSRGPLAVSSRCGASMNGYVLGCIGRGCSAGTLGAACSRTRPLLQRCVPRVHWALLLPYLRPPAPPLIPPPSYHHTCTKKSHQAFLPSGRCPGSLAQQRRRSRMPRCSASTPPGRRHRRRRQQCSRRRRPRLCGAGAPAAGHDERGAG